MEDIFDAKKIKEAFAKANSGERERILRFTVANTEPPPTGHVSSPFGYWHLGYVKNLDTGKLMLCAGFGIKPPGLSPNDFRKAIGLPPVAEKKEEKKPYKPSKPIRRIERG